MEKSKNYSRKICVELWPNFGLIMIIIGVVTYVTGMALKLVQWPQWLYYIIFPVTVIYAISQYKKQ